MCVCGFKRRPAPLSCYTYFYIRETSSQKQTRKRIFQEYGDYRCVFAFVLACRWDGWACLLLVSRELSGRWCHILHRHYPAPLKVISVVLLFFHWFPQPRVSISLSIKVSSTPTQSIWFCLCVSVSVSVCVRARSCVSVWVCAGKCPYWVDV